MSGWLPGLDSASGSFALPLWMAGALAALFVVVCIIALNRDGPSAAMRTLVRSVVVLVAALMVLALAQRPSGPDSSAIEARIIALNTRVLAPASPLACLTTSTGEAIESSCEKTLFANPETAAAAVSFVDAQVALLADASALRKSENEGAAIAGLRRTIETDRYGIVAHVFATRHGCANEHCRAFVTLLREPTRVRANLKMQKFDVTVRRYATAWPVATAPVLANLVPETTAPSAPAAPASNLANIDFPSAASIPAVSIMNTEPPAVAPAPAASAAPAAPRPQQAAPPQPAQPRRQASTNGTSHASAAPASATPAQSVAVTAPVPVFPMPLQLTPNAQ